MMFLNVITGHKETYHIANKEPDKIFNILHIKIVEYQTNCFHPLQRVEEGRYGNMFLQNAPRGWRRSGKEWKRQKDQFLFESR
jgi:hypothetical protein